MAESSSHNLSSPKITPKEEPVTLDKPESPNPLLPCGIRGDIGINTFRNALRDHYPPHSSGKTGGLDQISNKDATILYCLANRVKVDYAKLIWEDIIHKLNKKTKEKVVPYPSFFHLPFESASGHDTSADAIVEADPENSAPNDSIPS
ncbi:hypothetical protein Tco_1456002 [Tanacetum coccineum]